MKPVWFSFLVCAAIVAAAGAAQAEPAYTPLIPASTAKAKLAGEPTVTYVKTSRAAFPGWSVVVMPHESANLPRVKTIPIGVRNGKFVEVSDGSSETVKHGYERAVPPKRKPPR